MLGCAMYSSGLEERERERPLVGFCHHGNEPLRF